MENSNNSPSVEEGKDSGLNEFSSSPQISNEDYLWNKYSLDSDLEIGTYKELTEKNLFYE